MRYLSKIFQPIITIPKNAKIKNTEITCKSQKLLLENGLIHATSSGLYTLLPLARRAIDKLETLIRSCIEEVGAQRLSLPALTAANLWEKTGRLKEVGEELMIVEDRHQKKYVLAPTHEEAIANLLSDVGSLTYKQLPLLLYQINNKYRDERRPKHGLLRSREFSMLDLYGAHESEQSAVEVYEKVCAAYENLFQKLDLPVYKVLAPGGEMGGSVSHEWQIEANAGEDTLALCPSCSHARRQCETDVCERCAASTRKIATIEVGHTFLLGTRYSQPLDAGFVSSHGHRTPLFMSCYGIGITRLLAASLEALSSESSLRWPQNVAPFGAIVIGPKEGSKEWSSHGVDRIEQVANELSATTALADDVLVDDRHHLTIGKRLMMADRMGYPLIVVCGRSTLESTPRYEVFETTSHSKSTPREMTLEQLIDTLKQNSNNSNVKKRCVNKV